MRKGRGKKKGRGKEMDRRGVMKKGEVGRRWGGGVFLKEGKGNGWGMEV